MMKFFKKYKLMIIFMAIIIAAAVISNYVCQLSIISGDSMSPTYVNFEFSFINRMDKSLQRNDVIAINKEKIGMIVKRVYALPGDTVVIKNGALYVNGKKAAELGDKVPAGDTVSENEITLKSDEYFVMGDNLAQSKDSRFAEIGTIKSNEIIGKLIPQKNRK